MTGEPSYPLQRAIYAALVNEPAVQALIGDRVYDRVKPKAQVPYVTIGNDRLLDDGNGCGEAWQIDAVIDVWSRAEGLPETKMIASAVRSALVTELDLDGFEVVEAQHLDTVFLDDRDGITSHGVVRVRYWIDPE